MAKIRKIHGDYPMKTYLNIEGEQVEVEFDAEGIAEVESHIADVFAQVPGYIEQAEEAIEDPSEEESSEDIASEEEAPAKPTRKRPSIKK